MLVSAAGIKIFLTAHFRGQSFKSPARLGVSREFFNLLWHFYNSKLFCLKCSANRLLRARDMFIYISRYVYISFNSLFMYIRERFLG